MRGSAQQQPRNGVGEHPNGADVLAHGVARRVPRRRDLVCAGCGYGVVVASEPERCPLCGCSDWDFAPWRPFTRRDGPDLVA